MLVKVEKVAELRSSPQKILDVFANKAFLIPTYAPDFIQAVDVQADVCSWNYTIGGRAEVVKANVELDEANTITFIAVGGDMMKIYKHQKALFKLTPKGNGTILRLTTETEKRNAVVFSPVVYADFTLKVDAAT